MFSEPETDYLKSQNLARIATISKKGQPDLVPVGFEFDGKYFWIGSHNQEIFHRTLKYHNVNNGNKKVALVIDDLESVDPWRPRMIKVYGEGEIMQHEGQFGPGEYIRVTPKISWSMGIKGLKVQEGSFRLKTVHN